MYIDSLCGQTEEHAKACKICNVHVDTQDASIGAFGPQCFIRGSIPSCGGCGANGTGCAEPCSGTKSVGRAKRLLMV